jgi:F-type H+-transporting ATPase subunit epsilon
MALRIQVDVVSAEEQIFSGEAEFAVFPGEMGELGIFPRHAPLLTRVRPGAVRLKIPDRDEFELLYVSGGILEVQPTLITLLADTAIRAKDLDEAQAIKSRQQAEEALRKRSASVGYAGAEAELAQTITELRLHRLKKNRTANH